MCCSFGREAAIRATRRDLGAISCDLVRLRSGAAAGAGGRELEGDVVGILQRQDHEAERGQVGDLAVRDAGRLQPLGRRVQLVDGADAEAQVVEPDPVGVEAVAGGATGRSPRVWPPNVNEQPP